MLVLLLDVLRPNWLAFIPTEENLYKVLFCPIPSPTFPVLVSFPPWFSVALLTNDDAPKDYDKSTDCVEVAFLREEGCLIFDWNEV